MEFIIMGLLAIAGIVISLMSKNWASLIWIVNCMIWVVIAYTYRKRAEKLER